jgi:hypothetical protein
MPRDFEACLIVELLVHENEALLCVERPAQQVPFEDLVPEQRNETGQM